ncbi:MAG: FtsW/RodA/SpoVE family cell cycle protein [Bacillota bacterium]|nr:FtsW/RodA/SpoVE family cell cycle protein [Bacillota bacterium]
MFTRIRKSIIYYIKCTDLTLIGLTLASSLYGLLLVMSAVKSFDSNKLVIIQAAAVVLGFISMIVISNIDYEALGDIWMILYGLGIIALVITIFIGTGPTGTNNQNWINLGFIKVQPSEIVKLAFIISLATVISRFGEEMNQFKNLVFVLMLVGVMCGLILIQGDMGSTLVFLFIAIVMMFAGGLKLRYFIISSLTAVIAAPFIWTYGLTNYMRDRILFGFNPELDPSKVGYQAVQSKIAIGSGLLAGKGLFHGPQIQNSIVPAKQTDFIFAVAGEELGFIGVTLVILLLSFILIRILLNSRNCETSLGSLICIGVFAMLFIQIFENIGMCIGILPVIGITLPLFSYGGSSVVSVYISLGLVLSVVNHRKSLSFLYEE